jgi:HSP20 family protein
MNLIRWNPWRERSALDNTFNRFFGDTFFPTHWLDDESGIASWKPVVDIYDNDKNIVIKAELPGVDKKDIEVDLKDRVLTLKGERSYENEVKEDNYHRKERVYGKFHRSFTLPADYDPEKIKADFKDGVLKIEIPKPEEEKPKKIVVH